MRNQPQSFFDEDFLEPTLDASHDVGRIRRAFNPATLVWSSIILGPAGAALVVWRNNTNLKAKSFTWLLLVLVTLSQSLPFVLYDMEVSFMAIEDWRLTIRVLTVLCTLLATRKQAARYRIFVAEKGKPESFWIEGIVAFIVGYIVTYLQISLTSAYYFPVS